MKPIPFEARIPNVDDRPTQREVCLCEHCGDTGAVVAALRRYLEEFVEEIGPCPYCQEGYNLEFNSGAYGKDGFWQGRSGVRVESLYPSGRDVARPTDQVANAKRMIRMLDAGEIVKDVPE